MAVSVKKVVAFFASFVLFTVSDVFSANIAFMVVETNILDDVKNNHADVWESGVMDVFFIEGHVVSNASAMRIQENDREDFPPEALGDFQQAIQNGADYFVLATLNYKKNTDETNKKSPQGLATVSLKLFKISPYRFVYENKLAFEKKERSSSEKTQGEDELRMAKDAAKTLLPYL
ncbi:MAG: hypothetical protein LBC53_04320 [Spirochaetaceae bacterium]|jgi:hypothetical protein|nr:hypothetical protein [Spirochaetaceae bacterium]